MAVSIASGRGWAHGLPAEVTSFVGRRHEVAEVKRLLSGSRLVTLTGVGGVGKTRLASRVAVGLRRAFPGGVWLVELADLDKPELLVPAVIEALEIRDHSARPPMEVLIDHLCDRQALVVLDNCEHLLRDCAVMAETLLRVAPDLNILATSREALGIVGEQIMVVPALPLSAGPGSPDSGKALVTSDATRLFAERAAAVLPGFAVTEANREAVERICRRLDGLPLGIELAAVRLRALSVQQLLDRLDDRFRLLTAGSRTALPRHQTLHALIDWSYALCTEQERLLWARASVFSGGLDLEGAEAVCAGDGLLREEVIDLVIGLVDKSILIREEHPGTVRYRLLETIRHYGRERLAESGHEADFLRRHQDHFQALVTQAEREWFGPGQVAWFTRLRLEHANIRAALGHCLAEPGGAERGMAIAAALRFYWIAAGFLHEGRRWLDALLTAAPAPTADRANALVVNARLAVLQSDFPAADPMLDEARGLAGRLGEAPILTQTAYVSGLAALIQRDLPRAVAQLSEALERHQAADNQSGVVNTLAYIATAHSLLGHSDKAVPMFEECLALCEAYDDHWFRSYTQSFFGIELLRQGDTARASAMEHGSIRLKQPFDDWLGIALCIEVLAWIAADKGDDERAARLLGALRKIWRSVGSPMFGYLVFYHERCEATVRERLGPERFETVLQEGVQFTRDGLIAYALEERVPASPASAAAGHPSPLTRREMEAAELVARGMSNKEIAAAMVIANRTAEGHIEHIMTKLGFKSRAQIAAWITELNEGGPPSPGTP